MSALKTFTFDAKLFACFTVTAATEEEAREKLRRALSCADINAGNIDGEPLVGEASLDGDLDLVED